MWWKCCCCAVLRGHQQRWSARRRFLSLREEFVLNSICLFIVSRKTPECTETFQLFMAQLKHVLYAMYIFLSYYKWIKHNTRMGLYIDCFLKVCATVSLSYRCVTCRHWGTSGSDSIDTCCGTSCECDSGDHSDRTPTLTWLCVWRNPMKKRKKKERITSDVATENICSTLLIMLLYLGTGKRFLTHFSRKYAF